MLLILSLPALVQTQPPEWDKAKDQLDALLHEKGGVGLLISLEQKKPGSLTHSHLERGGSDSAWQLEILPLDPGTKQPGKGDTCTRDGGFTATQTRPATSELHLPDGTRQVLLRFRTAKFKGLGRVVDIPAAGAPPKVIYLHLPAIKD